MTSMLEQVANTVGGLIAKQDLDGRLYDWPRRNKKRLDDARRQGRPVELQLGYINDSSFNAWAATANDVDMIGVNSGVPVLLDFLFRALISHPAAFPDIGDTSTCVKFDSRFRVNNIEFILA